MSGADLKTQGQADVLAADTAVHRGAADTIRAVVDELAETGETFTADDVRGRLPDGLEPHSPNLLPAVMGSQARTGHIQAVGFTKSTRSSRRDGWMRTWQGITT